MEFFTDVNGEKWELRLNIATAKEVRDQTKIDLLNLAAVVPEKGNDWGEITALERIVESPITLVDVISVLCQKQIRERQMDEVEFAERFGPETIQDATDALIREIINFSQPTKKKVMARIHQVTQNFVGKLNKKMDEILDDPDFQSKTEEVLTKLFTNPQEFSASIPEDSPSEN